MLSDNWYLWIGFNVFVLGMLALDLAVFHRKAHEVSLREALGWSIVWIALALIFNAAIYHFWGQDKALEFLTGYVIEKALSVDNLFVFIMIFSYFSVPATYHHRVLFWGILGALVMRAVFIAGGVALLNSFHWMIYVFGGFLILTGIKMLRAGDEEVHPEKNPLLRLLRRLMPVTDDYRGQKFFVRQGKRLWATPLLLVLVVVESTDLIFAVDSIPAILAVTTDPFIVYSSNVFAILGLRALYFLLAGILDKFRYLKVGLSLVLCLVGVKMVIVDFYKVPIVWSLAGVAGILAVSILASVLIPPKAKRAPSGSVTARPPRAAGRKPSPPQAAASLAFILLAVGAAIWAAIQAGPTAHDAITALRVAERELAHARSVYGDSAGSTLSQAEKLLGEAWAALEERRYGDAILAARRAKEPLETLR